MNSRSHLLLSVLTLAVSTFALPPAALAANIEVTTNADEDIDPGTGVSFREALDMASPGDRITFSTSLPTAAIFFAAPALPQVKEAVEIDASMLTSRLRFIVSGAPDDLLEFVASPSTNVVRNINFEEANLVADSNVEFYDCTFKRAPSNVITAAGDLRMERCEIDSSPGILIDVPPGNKPVVTLIDCSIVDSHTLPAIECADPATTLSLIGTAIDSAVTVGSKAPVQFNSGTLLVERSSIGRCHSNTDGGAIQISGVSREASTLTLVNSTLSTNHSEENGGALFFVNTTVHCSHCTIVNNTCTVRGAGISPADDVSQVTLHHTILAGNLSAVAGPGDNFNLDSGSEFISEGFNLIDTDELPSPETGDMIGVQPLLAPLSPYGSTSDVRLPCHAPLAISPVIDAGDPDFRPKVTDEQRGYARLADGDADGTIAIDIGAVEAAEPVFVTNLDTQNVAGSLRRHLIGTPNGGRVLFDPSLDGAVLQLSPATDEPAATRSLQVDATTLPHGFTIDGGARKRCLQIGNGASRIDVATHAVTLRNGFKGVGGTGNDGTGANIYSHCSLTFSHGAIHGCRNIQAAGGGISVGVGGYLHVYNATISDNYGLRGGGGIYAAGRVWIEHATIVDNSAFNTAGGLHLVSPSPTSIYSSIIARNHDTLSDELSNFGLPQLVPMSLLTERLNSEGYILTDSEPDPSWQAAFDGIGDEYRIDPALLLAEGGLVDKGGWSPVYFTDPSNISVDAGDIRRRRLPDFDQRGFARVANVTGVRRIDVGAFEHAGAKQDTDADGMPDYWELLNGFDINDPGDANEDADGDGKTNSQEFRNGTKPKSLIPDPQTDPELPVITDVRFDHKFGRIILTFTGRAGLPFQLRSSGDLNQWIDEVDGVMGGGPQTSTIDASKARGFFRFEEPQ